MAVRKFFSYILDPLELLRTKKVLQVNPTIDAPRKEPEEVKIYVYDYTPEKFEVKELKKIPECFHYIETPSITWINVDGLRKTDVESISNHYGIHYLIAEDILSVGQRPKMDEINGLLFCVLNMLYFNEKESVVEVEQISIV